MKKTHVIALLVVTNAFSIGCLLLFLKAGKSDVAADSSYYSSETESGRYDKAVQAPTEDSGVDPNYILTQYDVGRQNRRKEVIETYQRAIRAEPPFTGVATTASTYARLGQFDKAIELCKKSIRFDPAYTEARYSLAWIYS
ncbi:MAG: hypothetical protein ACYSSO_15520, partial [Planctomycetota bacterium]